MGVEGTPRFAVVMTIRNMVKYVSLSLDTILPGIRPDGELVIVDANSTDGTIPYLRGLEEKGLLKLIVEPCTRGRGRHLGILATNAPIVLTQIDADVTYHPGVIHEVVEAFERTGKKGMMVAFGSRDANPGTVKMFVWDRSFYFKIGGYQDINLHDDMLILRTALSTGQVSRHIVQRMGKDLRVSIGERTKPEPPRARLKEIIRIARVMHGDGWSYRAYLKFLYLTRRTIPRYIAGSLIAAWAFALSPIKLSHEDLHKLTAP
jgi:glycosyltransferase involved in cell wall biosynthesis